MSIEDYNLDDYEISDDGKTVTINGYEYDCAPDVYNLINYLHNDNFESLVVEYYGDDELTEEEMRDLSDKYKAMLH